MRATDLMGLDIALPEFNQMNRKPLFVHDRSRLATATSIRFVAPDRVAAANFAGARLYLLQFDLTTRDWQILDSVDTTFEDQLVTTDLLEVDDAGQIITSNFHRYTASLYRYENDTVEFTRDIDVEFGGYTHRGLMAVTKYGDNTISIRRIGGRFRRWAPEIRRQLSAA